MKLQARVAILILGVEVVGCGKGTSTPTNVVQPQPHPQSTSDPQSQFVSIPKGVGFGYQCGQGFSSDPQPADLELWNCPLPVTNVELVQQLRPLTFQADCRKKTLDVRSPNHSFEAMTWEVMPDGNFTFSMDGGTAQLKNDGSGHLNCTTPLSSELWGRIDCADPDKPVIHIETLWWFKPFDTSSTSGTPTVIHNPPAGPSLPGSPAPSASPSPFPFPFPFPSPSPIMTRTPWPFLSAFSSPTPSLSPTPSPFPSVSPSPSGAPSGTPSLRPPHGVDVPVPVRHVAPSPTPSSGPSSTPCQVPTTCYFHNISDINQCR